MEPAQQIARLTQSYQEISPPVAGHGILVGPSHVARWKHQHTQGAVAAPFEQTDFIGVGGYPVWHRDLFDQVVRAARPDSRIVFILPDFRFGNSVLRSTGAAPGTLCTGHARIDRDLITPVGDAIMYRAHAEALLLWRAAFGTRLHVIDWTGILTAGLHMASDRYQENGRYANPAYAQWAAIDSARLGVAAPDAEHIVAHLDWVNGLYVDRSLHPSAIGYQVLQRCAQGLEAGLIESREAVVPAFGHWFNRLEAAIGAQLRGRGVNLAGDSLALEFLRRSFTPAQLRSLGRAGLTLEPKAPAHAVSILVSDTLEPAKADLNGHDLLVPWRLFARRHIAQRHKNNAALAPSPETLAALPQTARNWMARAEACAPAEQVLDGGDDGMPTLVGLMMLILSVIESTAP